MVKTHMEWIAHGASLKELWFAFGHILLSINIKYIYKYYYSYLKRFWKKTLEGRFNKVGKHKKWTEITQSKIPKEQQKKLKAKYEKQRKRRN
jgi:hypothetical protein